MSVAKRPEFMRMIEDAKSGKVNLILCKSISRFSRNFAEAEKFVHMLKACNVEVRFEKEGVNSFDPSSDLIFGTMAAIAQEESRSISENVKWTYKRLTEMGIRHVGNNHLLGYDEIKGKLTPNKDAWMVKMMFEEYAAGEAPSVILQHLKEKGAKRMRSDQDFDWSAVLPILKNEAYVGDRRIQKTAPIDFLTKKRDKTKAFESNYVQDDHEGIISREVWEAVQTRIKAGQIDRINGLHKRCNTHPLYGKVFCEKCGEPYKRYTCKHRNGDPYKVWRCRGRLHGCKSKTVWEDRLLEAIGTENREIRKIIIGDEGIEVSLTPACEHGKNATRLVAY